MKPTRIAKILAVILALAMLPLWTVGCGSKLCDNTFSTLKDQLLGDVKLDTGDAATKTYLTSLDAEVKNLMTFYSEGGWPLKMVKDGETQKTFHYKSIYKLAIAWNTKGSEYYHDGDVLAAAKAALQNGYEVHFGLSQRGANSKDFTLDQRETCALYLIRSVMLLQSKLKKAEIEEWFSILDLKFPAPVGEGLDKLRSTYICLAYYAYFGNTENVKKFATSFIDDVIALTDSGDGRYADGSYIWNVGNVSTLEGGVEAVDLLVDLYVALEGTECALPEATVEALYNWVVSMKHSLYNGSAMSSSLSTAITNGDYVGGTAIAAMLKVATICSEEQAKNIKSFVKSCGNQGDENKGDGKFAIGLGTYGAGLYAKVVKDKKIEPSTEVLGAYSYAATDTLSVLGVKFGLSIAMTSFRTNKYDTAVIPYVEPNTKETAHNGNLWFARDGMFTLYSNDYKLPSNYWNNVNTSRLPGTTVDNRPKQNIDVYTYNGITNYAGSAVIGSTAVAAMIVTGNNAEYLSDLNGKKAWFVFDDKVVCLGTDIHNSTVPKQASTSYTHNIETVIENIYYDKFNVAYTSEDDDITLTNAEKVLAGDSGINALFFTRYGGVYIPASNLDVVKTKLVTTDGGNYVELWIEHGATPDGASYEYAIYPSTVGKMGKFFEMLNENEGKADYTVLSNTGNVQAVKDDKTGSVGYVFWNGATCNGITTDFACNIMVKETDSQITIAIADISHNSPDNEGGTITLTGSFTQVKADAGLTFDGNTITVDRAVAGNGHTLTIVLSK